MYSPLHLLWAGGEAVSLFFVLSGFVLTLPVIRRGGFSWLAYYPSRTVRLYVPVIGSLVLAVVLSTLIPRTPAKAISGWEMIHTEPVVATTVAKDALLLGGASALNSPLWSLRWEVLFSLMLPLYVWLAVATRRFWWAVLLVALMSGLVAEASGFGALRYPPMFMVGCVMAVTTDQFGRVAAALHTRGPWAWRLLALAAAVGVTSWWVTRPANSYLLSLIAPVVVLCSVAVIVFLAAHWPAFGQVLGTPIFQKLGVLSFSLYLVHEPIVVSLGFLLPTELNFLTLVAGVPLSLGATWLFYRWVELPTHRLSQQIRRAIAQFQRKRVASSPSALCSTSATVTAPRVHSPTADR